MGLSKSGVSDKNKCGGKKVWNLGRSPVVFKNNYLLLVYHKVLCWNKITLKLLQIKWKNQGLKTYLVNY